MALAMETVGRTDIPRPEEGRGVCCCSGPAVVTSGHSLSTTYSDNYFFFVILNFLVLNTLKKTYLVPRLLNPEYYHIPTRPLLSLSSQWKGPTWKKHFDTLQEKLHVLEIYAPINSIAIYFYRVFPLSLCVCGCARTCVRV